MKLHGTLIEKLLKIYEINSGWSEERKLKEALRNLNVTVYTQQSGDKVLVCADDLENQRSGEK